MVISPLTLPCDLKCLFTSQAQGFFGKNVIGQIYAYKILVSKNQGFLFCFVLLFKLVLLCQLKYFDWHLSTYLVSSSLVVVGLHDKIN